MKEHSTMPTKEKRKQTRKKKKAPQVSNKRKKKLHTQVIQQKKKQQPNNAINHKRKKKSVKRKKRTQQVLPSRKKKNQLKKIYKELLLTMIIVVSFISVIHYFTFRIPKVADYGMVTILNNGDRLFVNKLGKLRRFKLIYYKNPQTNEKEVRRLIGLPGEIIEYRNDQLYVNNEPVVERFLEEKLQQISSTGTVYTEDFTLVELFKKDQVPSDHYFVLGDNRQFALDSRTFGYIQKKDVIGIVEMRLLPLHTVERF